MKKCNSSRCTQSNPQPLSAFYKSSKTRDGYDAQCIACHKQRYIRDKQTCLERQKQYYENNREKILQYTKRWREENQSAVKDKRLREAFGIGLSEYEQLLSAQDRKCAICFTEDFGRSGTKYFDVDHCHKSGEVRGLLCSKCNKALGLFGDSVDVLQQAVAYLQRCKGTS